MQNVWIKLSLRSGTAIMNDAEGHPEVTAGRRSLPIDQSLKLGGCRTSGERAGVLMQRRCVLVLLALFYIIILRISVHRIRVTSSSGRYRTGFWDVKYARDCYVF